jgi:hypothetical protein
MAILEAGFCGKYSVVARALGLLAAGVSPAVAAPSALVESVSAAVPGVTPMGYLSAGTTVELGTSTTLVIDYLSKCVRETITGGTVTIGADQSAVANGHVSRKRMDCEGGDLQVAADVSDQGAVTEYRLVGDTPTLTIHSTAPLVLARTAGSLVIERIDKAEPEDSPIAVQAAPNGDPVRVTIDFALERHELAPGGIYRITLGTRKLVFRVDPAAAGAAAPLLARLLPI